MHRSVVYVGRYSKVIQLSEMKYSTVFHRFEGLHLSITASGIRVDLIHPCSQVAGTLKYERYASRPP